jgi:drug/metabolite transporter (DMT)-like permease
MWTVWLWMTGLRGVPASRAGVFTVMLPVTAAAVGVLVLGETLSALQWLAFVLALSGLILATMPAASMRPKA